MNKKRPLIILVFAIILLACWFFGVELLMMALSGTEGERLSVAEMKMLRRLERDCMCKVKILHASADDGTIADSTLQISFYWKTKAVETKDTLHNMVTKDDNIVVPFLNKAIQELVNTVPGRAQYKFVHFLLKNDDIYDAYRGQIQKEISGEYRITTEGETELLYLNRY